MRKTLFFTATIIGCIILLSNNAGRGRVSGNPATTSPGESGQFCGTIGCHFGQNFNPDLVISLLDNQGNKVTEYVPGDVYTVTMEINHTGFPGGYGFQIVSLKDSDNTGINKWVDIPAGIHDVSLLGRQYLEQNSRLPFDSIPLSWEAPQEGTGSVTFYGVGNAVNGNGNSSGDGADTSFLRIIEAEISSISSLEDQGTSISLFPNPCQSNLFVDSKMNFDQINIFDQQGKRVLTSLDTEINVSELTPGMHFVELNLDNKKWIKKIMKL